MKTQFRLELSPLRPLRSRERHSITGIRATAVLVSLALLGVGCAAKPAPMIPSIAARASEETQTTESVDVARASVPIPEDLGLSDREQRAVEVLAAAEAFGGEAVGYSGQPTEQVKALRFLIDAPNGEAALQLVLEHGTMSGQLLALSGLYFADHQSFQNQLPKYRAMEDTVEVLYGGCFVGSQPIAIRELMQAPGAMQLTGPDDNFRKWVRRHPGVKRLTYDIEGGGYPMAIAGR